MEFNKPLTTLEDAKRYYQAMGCSHFHMAREYPEPYQEYRTLKIAESVEAQ